MPVYIERRPSPAFAAVVEKYWFLDAPKSVVPAPVSPDGRMELVFHFGCAAREHRSGGLVHEQPSTLLVGQMDRPVWLSHAGRLCAAGIRLRPGAAGSLGPIPAGEFSRHIVDASEVLRVVRDVPSRLFDARNIEAQVGVLESMLDRLSLNAPAPSIAPAVAAMERSHGRLRISALAAAMGIERRTLERAFRRDVGLAPKTFARILRFQRACRLVSSGCTLAATALECGYYDQAHMTGDFVEYAGVSPTAWKDRRDVQLFATNAERGTQHED